MITALPFSRLPSLFAATVFLSATALQSPATATLYHHQDDSVSYVLSRVGYSSPKPTFSPLERCQPCPHGQTNCLRYRSIWGSTCVEPHNPDHCELSSRAMTFWSSTHTFFTVARCLANATSRASTASFARAIALRAVNPFRTERTSTFPPTKQRTASIFSSNARHMLASLLRSIGTRPGHFVAAFSTLRVQKEPKILAWPSQRLRPTLRAFPFQSRQTLSKLFRLSGDFLCQPFQHRHATRNPQRFRLDQPRLIGCGSNRIICPTLRRSRILSQAMDTRR